LEEAFEKCKSDHEVFVLGGEEIFKLSIPFADKIYLTLVHETMEGDAFFPAFNENEFNLTERKEFFAGQNTPYDISILTYERKNSSS
jgi:dihydrofolate reductase